MIIRREIGEKGQVVIPKIIREMLKLRKGKKVVFEGSLRLLVYQHPRVDQVLLARLDENFFSNTLTIYIRDIPRIRKCVFLSKKRTTEYEEVKKDLDKIVGKKIKIYGNYLTASEWDHETSHFFGHALEFEVDGKKKFYRLSSPEELQ